MLHIYTYGTESKQFLILRPAQADLINEFTARFFEAQELHLQIHGVHWTPDEPIAFNWSNEKMAQYNKLAASLDRHHAIRNKLFDLLRIDVRDEPMADYLVKRF